MGGSVGLEVVYAYGLWREVWCVENGFEVEKSWFDWSDALLLSVVVSADEVGVLARVLPLAQTDEDESAGSHYVSVFVAAAVLGAYVCDEGVVGCASVEHAVSEHFVDACVLLEGVLGEAQFVGGCVAWHCV